MKKELGLVLLMGSTGCTSLGILSCPGVIGVGYNASNENSVDFVYTGSPADKLGIDINDYLINPKEWRGAPGERVLIKWKHNGELHQEYTNLVCLKELREWK